MNKKGFTLVEITVVIAIVLFLFVISIPVYSHLYSFSHLKDQYSELKMNMRAIKQRSLAGLNDSTHGIKFFTDKYVLFKGADYDSRDPDFDFEVDMPNNVSLNWTLSSGEDEIVFSQGLGLPNQTGEIDLSDTVGNEMKTIHINSQGILE